MLARAGQVIRAADFGGYASDVNATDESNFNSTSYTLGSVTVGTSFVAPTSGNVMVLWGGRIQLNNATGLRVLLSCQVATGATVGAGTVIAPFLDSYAVEIGSAASDRLGNSRHRLVEGLTPGQTYNVSLWHKNGASVASAGSIFDRDVTVMPWRIG